MIAINFPHKYHVLSPWGRLFVTPWTVFIPSQQPLLNREMPLRKRRKKRGVVYKVFLIFREILSAEFIQELTATKIPRS